MSAAITSLTKNAWPMPEPGSIIKWCRFPYSSDPITPNMDMHPVLVLGEYPSAWLHVAMGTSKRIDRAKPWDVVTPDRHGTMSRFRLDHTALLPWGPEWFHPIQGGTRPGVVHRPSDVRKQLRGALAALIGAPNIHPLTQYVHPRGPKSGWATTSDRRRDAWTLAIRQGNTDLMAALLDAGWSDITTLVGGDLPLHIAQRAGADDLVQRLLTMSDAAPRHPSNTVLAAAFNRATPLGQRVRKDESINHPESTAAIDPTHGDSQDAIGFRDESIPPSTHEVSTLGWAWKPERKPAGIAVVGDAARNNVLPVDTADAAIPQRDQIREPTAPRTREAVQRPIHRTRAASPSIVVPQAPPSGAPIIIVINAAGMNLSDIIRQAIAGAQATTMVSGSERHAGDEPGSIESRKKKIDPLIHTRNEQIITRYLEGATYRQIAQEHAIAFSAVNAVIRDAGVAQGRNDNQAERNASIIQRYKDGTPRRVIAAEFGVSTEVVKKAIRKSGAAEGRTGQQPNPANVARNAQIIERYLSGMKVPDVARNLAVTEKTVAHVVSAAGATQGRGRKAQPAIKERNANIFRRYHEGESRIQIARDLGVTVQVVNHTISTTRRAQRGSLSSAPPTAAQKRNAEIVRRVGNGEKPVQIARDLGVKRTVVDQAVYNARRASVNATAS